eukprot:TRINITY_DN22865_c0_g1_i1.p1 TRINITY_DN22865_c0_g1~~TRINITY_DN22865_c0_g1_i1.p1  ORF type:complete len:232 (-),score=15.42 TRINITY_DN22865_c0_g1_i1:481-1176(-)
MPWWQCCCPGLATKQRDTSEIRARMEGYELNFEEAAYLVAEDVLGRASSTPLEAYSIGDAMYMFLDYVRQQLDGEPEDPPTRSALDMCSDMADVANQRLIDEDMATKLLRCIGAKLQRKGFNCVDWFNEDGLLQPAALAEFIRNCSTSEQYLARALERLLNLVVLDQQGQVQELRSDSGVGIMCWYAAAHPQLYLDAANEDFLVPPISLLWMLPGSVTFTLYDRKAGGCAL